MVDVDVQTLMEIKRHEIILQRRYDDLLTKHNEVLAAIRALMDETDMEYEGKLSSALRQYVWDDDDNEALREMEGENV